MKTRIIVNVSDAKISTCIAEVLATYSLGSCIGVCLYDRSKKIGGMLHYQLPDSKMDAEKAQTNPFMFADSGIRILVEKLLSVGANKKLLQVKIAGGAAMQAGPEGFDIGKRNHLAIRKIMWKNGLMIDAEDVGGSAPRNLYMNIANGAVTVRTTGMEKQL